MVAILINTEPNSELYRKHVCYYVIKDGEELRLMEVSNVFHQHPDGPCEIPHLEEEIILTTTIRRDDHPEVFLLYNQQLATRKLNKAKNDEHSEAYSTRPIRAFGELERREMNIEPVFHNTTPNYPI